MARQDLRERLEGLVADPEEAMDVEIKCWLDLQDQQHRAHVAKEAIALANYGGGLILFGFEGKGVPPRPATPRPADLDDYHPDEINAIVRRYAAPAFHCSVKHVSHPQTGEIFPVVVVPGEHTAPIKAKRHSPDGKLVKQGEVYTRKPGAISEPASPEEIDEIWARCSRVARIQHDFPVASPAVSMDEDGFGTGQDWLRHPVIESAPDSERRRTPVNREELRQKISEDQQAVLTAIWEFYLERNEWVPKIDLHRRFIHQFRKAGVQAALVRLPEGICVTDLDGGRERYCLTFAGVLLADRGKQAEPLLVRYLEHVKGRYLDGDGGRIKSEGVAAALSLDPEEVRFLGRVLRLSSFGGNSSGLGGERWEADFPRDVDDLAEAEDMGTYLWDGALWNVAWVDEVPLWEGVEWDGHFLAASGPLESLTEKDAEPHDPRGVEALREAGFEVSWARRDNVPKDKSNGWHIAYETDRLTWKRKLLFKAEPMYLMARRCVGPTTDRT